MKKAMQKSHQKFKMSEWKIHEKNCKQEEERWTKEKKVMLENIVQQNTHTWSDSIKSSLLFR